MTKLNRLIYGCLCLNIVLIVANLLLTGANHLAKNSASLKTNFNFYHPTETKDLNIYNTAIMADRMNELFIGISNPITIILPDYTYGKYRIRGENGLRLKRTGWNHYDAEVSRPGRTNIVVEEIASGMIKKFPFRVRRLPELTVNVAGKMSGLIAGGELAAQRKINIHYENVGYDTNSRVTAYTFYYTAKRQDPVMLKVLGENFSKEVLYYLQHAKAGDHIAFLDIKVRTPDHRCFRRINSISLKIK